VKAEIGLHNFAVEEDEEQMLTVGVDDNGQMVFEPAAEKS
jgi:hypothetical protein